MAATSAVKRWAPAEHPANAVMVTRRLLKKPPSRQDAARHRMYGGLAFGKKIKQPAGDYYAGTRRAGTRRPSPRSYLPADHAGIYIAYIRCVPAAAR